VIEGTLWGRWQWWTVLGLYPKLAVLTQALPIIFMPIASLVTGLTAPREKSSVPLIPWIIARIEGMVQQGKDVKTPLPETNLVNQLLNVNKVNHDLKLIYIKQISRSNFLAGHATMTASITGCVAGIASRRDMQQQFENECRKPEMALENLCQEPLVNASIKEGLRLYSGTGANLDRKVPAGGLSLHGYFIPGGTDIGTSSAILQTNKEVFGEDAAEFKPERWLSRDSSQVSRLKTISLVWGEPHRRCPGQHLAAMLVNMIVPRLFREFDIQVQGPDDHLATAPPFFTTSIAGYSARFLSRKN
jgi:cytochrome P450